jgi:hypothetical protein
MGAIVGRITAAPAKIKPSGLHIFLGCQRGFSGHENFKIGVSIM